MPGVRGHTPGVGCAARKAQEGPERLRSKGQHGAPPPQWGGLGSTAYSAGARLGAAWPRLSGRKHTPLFSHS